MKHANNRRSRGRSNGKRYPNQRGGVFESNGPEIKVRGTPQQVQEKYLALARDAQSAGDRVQAEAYFQHAEHYLRIISGDDDGRGNRNGGQPSDQVSDHDGDSDDDEEYAADHGRRDNGGGGRDDGDGDSDGDDQGGRSARDNSQRGGRRDDGDGGNSGNSGGGGGGRSRGRGRGRRQAKSQDDGAAADPANQPQPDVSPREPEKSAKDERQDTAAS